MTFAEYLIQHKEFHIDAPYTRQGCLICEVVLPEIERLKKEIENASRQSENQKK